MFDDPTPYRRIDRFFLRKKETEVPCVIKHNNTQPCVLCGEKQVDGWLKYCLSCAKKLRVMQNGGAL